MRAPLLVGLLLAAGAFVAAQPVDRPDFAGHFVPRFHAWLWTFGDQRIDGAFAEKLRALAISGINRDGTADASRVREHGLHHYVGHAVSKRVFTLHRNAFQPRWDAYWRSRDPADLIRPSCLCREDVLERLKTDLRRTIEAQREHEPMAYALGDEISVTRRVTPLDFSFGDAALASFREWLKERYGTLDALNRTWGTEHGTWDDVRPMTADATRRRERRRGPDHWRLGPWNDHRAHTDWTLARVLRELHKEARSLGVKAPVGFLGGQAPAPYGGYDWSRLVRSVSWVEAYDEGGSMEVIRGLAPDLIRVRTYFPERDDRLNTYRLWRYLAHGDRGAILWSSRTVLDAKGQPTAFGQSLASTLRWMRRLSPRWWWHRIEVEPIAMYYSQASIRVGWMRDSWRDGATWMKRFGSYERTHSSQYRSRIAWHRLLEDAGMQYSYVDRRRDLDSLEVLVLPSVHVLTPGEVSRFLVFLERGGRILCDLLPAALGRVLEARPQLASRVTLLEGLGGRTQECRATVRRVLREAELQPPARIRRADGIDGGIELIRRRRGEEECWFVSRNLSAREEREIRGDEWDRSISVTLELPREVAWAEYHLDASLPRPETKRGRTITCRVAATRPALLVVNRPEGK